MYLVLLLFVLPGLQIMDSQAPEFFQQRLDKVVSLLQQVPASIPIHLELASMANREFVRQIISKVIINFLVLAGETFKSKFCLFCCCV